MKLKTKILTMVLALCFIVPCMFMLTACGHEHSLTKVDATSATCSKEGNTEYYECDCGEYFSDDKGETKIEKDSWVIGKLPHTYTNSGDDTCNNCPNVRELNVTGEGTEANPYVLSCAEHFEFIGENSDTYNYYKIAEDIEQIDATNLPQVNLNGSFDGSGVVFKNATKYIFRNVGSGSETDTTPVVISNFTVEFEGGMGVVRNCGATSLKFKDVNVSGYLLCDWNAGAFFRYGTSNVTDDGFSYVVDFVNCDTEVEIYSSSNSYSAILIGHPYQGTGNTVTINVDAKTEENLSKATLYYTGNGAAYGNKYCCIMTAGTTVNVEGVETPVNKTTEGVVKVDSTKVAVKDSQTGNYKITTEADTKKIIVTLLIQYTIYTDDTFTEKVPDESGVGGRFDTVIELDVTSGQAVDVLNSFSSVNVVSNADKYDYEVKDNVLTIYLTNNSTYIDGRIELVVEQFSESYSVAKYKGSVNIATKTKADEWVIK